MSLFLLQSEDWLKPGYSPPSQCLSPNKKAQRDYLDRLDNSIQAQIRKHKAYTDISMFQNLSIIRYSIVFQCVGYATKGLMSLNFKKMTGEISLQIDLLNAQNGYLKFDNRHQTIKVCRNLIFKQAYDKLLSKMSVKMETRQLKAHIPYFTHRFCNPFEYKYENVRDNLILFMFKRSMQVYVPYVENVLGGILPLERRRDVGVSENDLLSKIYKYSDMLVVDSHLCDSMIEAEKQVVEREQAKELSILRLCQNKQRVPASLIKSCQVMSHTPDLDLQLNSAEDYYLGGRELQMVEAMTGMPYQAKSTNPNENSMILNSIIVNTSQKIQLKKINEGGFCGIYMTQLPFWYTLVSEKDRGFNRQEVMIPKKILKKYCVIKLEEAAKKQKNRNQHEINILKIMKNGTSIFIPKYYVPVNQRNPFPNSVIMDFIPFHNLGQFLIASKMTLSLQTKLYLMFSIVQSLRYIRDFKIVHLDIKPSNIMIYCNLLIKLIDFGQSYHPDLCKKNHKPGITPPYSPPEIFEQGNKYTDKSDVFSLGVLFYQMIYGRFPFEIYKQKTNLQRDMKSYLNLWFFSVQEYESYGDSIILRIMNNLLSKCLAMNGDQRPGLDWLALIIRLCLQMNVC